MCLDFDVQRPASAACCHSSVQVWAGIESLGMKDNLKNPYSTCHYTAQENVAERLAGIRLQVLSGVSRTITQGPSSLNRILGWYRAIQVCMGM